MSMPVRLNVDNLAAAVVWTVGLSANLPTQHIGPRNLVLDRLNPMAHGC